MLREIPTSGWCVELERFIDQVKNEVISLSGNKFFNMTRKLLFGMAGTVVTYELVLLQFDNARSSQQNNNTDATITIVCD